MDRKVNLFNTLKEFIQHVDVTVLKVSELFYFTFVFISRFVFLISSLFLHFIVTKLKPNNIYV